MALMSKGIFGDFCLKRPNFVLMNFIFMIVKLCGILKVNVTQPAYGDCPMVMLDLHVIVESVLRQECSATLRARVLQIVWSHLSVESIEFHGVNSELVSSQEVRLLVLDATKLTVSLFVLHLHIKLPGASLHSVLFPVVLERPFGWKLQLTFRLVATKD